MLFLFFMKWSFYWNISFYVILLLLMLLFSYYYLKIIINNKMMKLLLKMNLLFCFIFFISKNIMMMFIFYEFAIFPILILISFWGYQIERIMASSFFLGYTLFFSIPSFLLFILMQSYFYNLDNIYFLKLNKIFLLFLLFMFLVKVPMFLLHIWLPKAHVESPTLGSILLAAILLKLGAFGLLKFMYLINNKYIFYVLFLIMLIGSIFSCFLCFLQSDFKALIAYSSIVHMNFMLLVLLLNSFFSKYMIFFMMLFHAFISTMMFFMSGMFFMNFKSRKIYFTSLNSNNMKLLLIMMIIIFLLNFNIPPSLGIIPEMYFFYCIFKQLKLSWMLLLLMGMLSSFFCILIIMTLSGGKTSMFKMNSTNITFKYFNITFIFISFFYFLFLLF